MGIRSVLKGAVIAGFLASVGATAAYAQTQACEETEFTSKTGQIYLDAEQAATAHGLAAANFQRQFRISRRPHKVMPLTVCRDGELQRQQPRAGSLQTFLGGDDSRQAVCIGFVAAKDHYAEIV